MNVVFQIEGDLGVTIAATAVCKAIKRHYPYHQLIVISDFPPVFLCNPIVNKNYHRTELRHFYEEYLQERANNLYFLLNPQLSTEFLNKKKNLIAAWCSLYHIPYHDEQPELYLTQREYDFYRSQIGNGKPITVIQTNGGMPDQPRYSWTKDIPQTIAQSMVDRLAQEYRVLHIRREDQSALKNAIPINPDFRTLTALIAMSDFRIFNDGFCQHLAAAVGKPSLVFWVANSPDQYGYTLHTNIHANPATQKPDLKNSVFVKYNPIGLPGEFPYQNETEIFDMENVNSNFTAYTLARKQEQENKKRNAEYAVSSYLPLGAG